MTELTKKRGRPKKPTTPKTEEGLARQKATQFQPGNKANADGWSMRKETRAYRKYCSNLLLSEEGQKALVIMYTELANSGRFREFMELQRFLAEYAYGKPKEMLETEETVQQLSSGNEHVAPLFGFVKGAYDDAIDTDSQYL